VKVIGSRAEFLGAREEVAGPVALVTTMGALHAGHAALFAAARPWAQSLIATIFVNPLQFGPAEDLRRYPRTLEADLACCTAGGVDLVWVPEVADVYPGGDARVRIDPGPLGADMEGAARPGHFAGVLTVVAKFFTLIRPAVAMFGEKDYQQLTLVRRMSGDLDLGVGVAGVPTVREPDGLALSSRNVYLSPEDRARALALPQALFAAREAAPGGSEAVLAAAQAVLDAEPRVRPDYLALRDPDLGPPPTRGPARLLCAVRVGSTRLIDNVGLDL
jgi:pantoate--beta-alanine ligase